MDHFFSWDDEWGQDNGFEAVQDEEPVIIESSNNEQMNTIPFKEHQVEAVEAAPVQHVEQPTQDWFGADEWGSSSYTVQPEPEPVVQQPVREPVREPMPEPVPEPKVSKVVAPQRKVAPQPRTNSWNKEPSTSLFAASATNKPKQTKHKKAVKPPQKQTQKRSEEKKRQPTKNVTSKAVPKKDSQTSHGCSQSNSTRGSRKSNSKTGSFRLTGTIRTNEYKIDAP